MRKCAAGFMLLFRIVFVTFIPAVCTEILGNHVGMTEKVLSSVNIWQIIAVVYFKCLVFKTIFLWLKFRAQKYKMQEKMYPKRSEVLLPVPLPLVPPHFTRGSCSPLLHVAF